VNVSYRIRARLGIVVAVALILTHEPKVTTLRPCALRLSNKLRLLVRATIGRFIGEADRSDSNSSPDYRRAAVVEIKQNVYQKGNPRSRILESR